MSGPWQDQDLLQPITEGQPCGEDLEDTPLLASLAAFRVFGQRAPYDDESPVAWAEVRSRALEALSKSKDLRILTYLGAAALRTDGFAAFADAVGAAAAWLERHWLQVYPRLDEDAVIRKNALNCFADPFAIVDAVRRLPLVSSRQHGNFSLRDLDIVAGVLKPAGSETPPDGTRIDAAFTEMPIEQLAGLHEAVVAAAAAVKSIEAAMLREGGMDAVPALDPLGAQLSKMERLLGPRLAARAGAAPADDAAASPPAAAAAGVVAVGAITSRQDAIRALDAVADFFRRNEPSSPIPMFVDRAKRLVSKNFLEVLADVAPDAVGQAMLAGGITEAQSE